MPDTNAHDFRPMKHFPNICTVCGGMRIAPDHGYDMAEEVAKLRERPGVSEKDAPTPQRETAVKCLLCGEPMLAGEEMFNYHGYFGPCPKPPLPHPEQPSINGELLATLEAITEHAEYKRGTTYEVSTKLIEQAETAIQKARGTK